MNISSKKIKIIILILLVTLGTFVILYWRLNQTKTSINPNDKLLVSKTPQPITISVQPKKIADIPRLTDQQGGGINTQTKTVVDSVKNIESLSSKLPFNNSFTSSSGLEVEILIPSKEYLENDWTLTVQMFGIDYQVPDGDPEYESMKQSFREGANIVFKFIEDAGLNPNDFIILWGNRQIIQDSSEKWLQ